jgi:hypothetical protein
MQVFSKPMWPVMFHVAEFDEASEEKPKLVELSYRLRAQADKQTWDAGSRAKLKLFESPSDFLEHGEAAALVQFFGTVIASIYVSFPESWCHITNGGGFHDAHAHAPFTLNGVCGIYYIQCRECTLHPPNGINRFYSPSVFETNDVADFEPKEGRLILFPGNIRHAALPYAGQEDRIVVAFNARLHEPEAEGAGEEAATP